jgi:DNA-binding winged helix-turn-helix (wHTH) protein
VQRRASRGGTPLQLRSGEFDALLALAECQGRPISHEDLHRHLWPDRAFSKKRVALCIHHLRRAIGDDRRNPILHTLYDQGYVLAARRPESGNSRCAA